MIQKRAKNIIRERVAELIELMRLKGYEKHYPGQLSGGQQQRVALARALAPEPQVLLLDEPFGALDAKVRKNLASWLRQLHKQIQVTTLFVTHDQNEAIEIADRIVLLNRGKVEQVGSAAEVYEQPASKFVASFVGNINVLEAKLADRQIELCGSREKFTARENHLPGNGPVVVLVRPEDIMISRRREPGDSFTADVSGVQYRGYFYELEFQVGTNLIKATVDKSVFQSNPWGEGEKGFLRFRKMKLFDAHGGHQEVRTMLKSLGYIE